MNFLGTGKPQIKFEWEGETKIFLPDHHRIQFIPTLNIEDVRIHKSVLNGTVTKEHLGYYSKAELYYYYITETEYEEILRFTECVDTVELTCFVDNLEYKINMIVTKAKPYEIAQGQNQTAFKLVLEGSGYSEAIPKPFPLIFMGCLAIEPFLFPVEPVTSGCLAIDELE